MAFSGNTCQRHGSQVTKALKETVENMSMLKA